MINRTTITLASLAAMLGLAASVHGQSASGSQKPKPSCPAGQVACVDATGRAGACRPEASLQADINNCGACGNACRRSDKCVAGKCVSPNACPAGQVACVDATGRQGGCRTEASLQADINNCGACGNICKRSDKCVAGKCVSPNACPEGQVACLDATGRSGGCRPVALLQADRNNCGGCGNLCRNNEKCIQGVCNACPAGSVSCMLQTGIMGCITNDAMRSDKYNCGGCGKACRMGEGCREGVCQR